MGHWSLESQKKPIMWLGIWAKIGWEMRFEQNLGWEVGSKPQPLPAPPPTRLQDAQHSVSPRQLIQY